MKNVLMTHMIPFFPDRRGSIDIARAMVDGGTSYLEVQFPFSDPTADGPAIQGAGSAALNAGFRLDEGWRFLEEIVPYAAHAGVDVFVMSYASPVFVYGIDRYVREAASRGVRGLIVPDLPVDLDEGLYAAGEAHGVAVVPVIALGAAAERIDLTLGLQSEFVYASLRRGTTGAYTEIGAENVAFLQSLTRDSGTGKREVPGGANETPAPKILAGFGISTVEQVDAVLRYAHAAVVGSAFVRAAGEADAADGGSNDFDGSYRKLYQRIFHLTRELARAD